MQIKAILDYKDTEFGRIVKAGEEFAVTEDRGKQLIAARVGKDISDMAKEPQVATKPQGGKRKKKEE